jgi:RNA polymerase sigma-70 factor, ECF subfamily
VILPLRWTPWTVSMYFHSTRGELLRRLGRDGEARAAYRRALELATTTAEQRFLTWRLKQL